jgi:hypothetical protein
LDNKESIDTEYIEVKNDCYVTAPQIAQWIGSTDISVRYWADTFFDLLGLEKSNGRKRYKQSDVNKFAFLKDLIDVKKFSHNQVRAHISKNGFKYAEFDAGLMNPKDPLGFQALASALSVEVDDKLNKYSEKIYSDINNLFMKYMMYQDDKNTQMKAEIEASVGEIVNSAISQIETQQNDLKDSIAITMTETIDSSLDQKLDSKLHQLTESIANQFKIHIDERELEYQKTNQEVIDRLKANMDETREKYLQEQKQNKKGLFGIFFNSKK